MASDPDTSQADSRDAHLNRAFELIGAVANRDAAPEEIVTPCEIAAQLRNQGIDSLDILVSLLARAAEQPADRQRRAARPIDIRQFSQPSPPEDVARIKHRPPKIPFVLNGTLYDPNDIRRFNGSELHLVRGPRRDDLFAFNDRSVISRIWEMTYVISITGAIQLDRFENLRDGPEHFPGILWPTMDHTGAYFWEDSGPGGWGSAIYLSPNTGFWDLTRVGRGLFGLGNWNDVISSFSGHGQVYVVALYEHINMGGSSLTDRWAESQLDYLGWNDRASSCACW